jgi:hypothetical protein
MQLVKRRTLNKKYFYLCIYLALSLTATAQKASESNFIEDSLRQELIRTTTILESKKKEADRLLYLLTAKEMAIRSIELKDDSIFSKIPNKTDNELVEIESKMAEKLCSQIKRNMTVFEWEKFSPNLNYEKTCGR